MSFDFSSLTVSKSLSNKGTLKDFVFEKAGQGYNIYTKKNYKSPIHLGKNGRMQILFKNKAGKEILLHISRQLDEKISTTKIKIEELENCLVYILERDGYPELVLGVNSSFETIDTKNFTDEDWSNLFSTENYIKSRIRK